MFRHYCVILRELVINTLLSYVSISDAAVGKVQFTTKMFHTDFIQVSLLYSLKCQYYKTFITLKLYYLQ